MNCDFSGNDVYFGLEIDGRIIFRPLKGYQLISACGREQGIGRRAARKGVKMV